MKYMCVYTYMGLPGGTSGKKPPANAGDTRDVSLIPMLGRFPGRGHGNPLQYSFFLNRSENIFFKMYLFIYLAAQVLVMACGI